MPRPKPIPQRLPYACASPAYCCALSGRQRREIRFQEVLQTPVQHFSFENALTSHPGTARRIVALAIWQALHAAAGAAVRLVSLASGTALFFSSAMRILRVNG